MSGAEKQADTTQNKKTVIGAIVSAAVVGGTILAWIVSVFDNAGKFWQFVQSVTHGEVAEITVTDVRQTTAFRVPNSIIDINADRPLWIEANVEKKSVSAVRECYGQIQVKSSKQWLAHSSLDPNITPLPEITNSFNLPGGAVKMKPYKFVFMIPVKSYPHDGDFRLVCNGYNIVSNWQPIAFSTIK